MVDKKHPYLKRYTYDTLINRECNLGIEENYGK